MKKRHHFIPQFYLRGFTKQGSAEVIWTYDMRTGECRGTSVNNTAFETHCYSITLPDGSRTDDLENMIAHVEGISAPILSKILARSEITDQERADFASFIALMYVRTDAWRTMFANVVTSGLQLKNFHTASNDAWFEAEMAKYQASRGKLTESELADLREGMLHPEDFALEVDKEWTLRALEFHGHLARIFFGMTWTVLDVVGSKPLITGDNPVFYGLPNNNVSPIYGAGLMHKDIEVTMPLTSSSAMLMTWNKEAPKRVRIGSDEVKVLNRVRAYNANRFLFGPSHDGGIVSLAAKFRDQRPTIRINGDRIDKLSPVTIVRRKR